MVYNLSIFEVICKKSYFLRQIMKLTVKVCLVLHTGPIGTQNKDPRPLLNSFRCHEPNGSLRIGKRASIKNYIF